MIKVFDEKTDREAKRRKQADGSAGRDSGGGDDGDSSDRDHDDDYVDQEVKHAQWFKDVTMICKEKVPRVCIFSQCIYSLCIYSLCSLCINREYICVPYVPYMYVCVPYVC